MSQLEQEFWEAELRATDVGPVPGEGEGPLTKIWDAFQKQVGDNPKITIAVGLAAGVILGWLIKRRG